MPLFPDSEKTPKMLFTTPSDEFYRGVPILGGYGWPNGFSLFNSSKSRIKPAARRPAQAGWSHSSIEVSFSIGCRPFHITAGIVSFSPHAKQKLAGAVKTGSKLDSGARASCVSLDIPSSFKRPSCSCCKSMRNWKCLGLTIMV